MGVPAVFVRLTGCNLQCTWCDTLDVWKKGNNYELAELADTIAELAGEDQHTGYSSLNSQRVHVVITGGEPLLQDVEIKELIRLIKERAPFAYFELETNGTLDSPVIGDFQQVNCSPKLASAGEPLHKRCNPSALARINRHANASYKFVIGKPSDWDDLVKDYERYIELDNIYLMPAALTREELVENSRMVWNLAAQHKVRMTTRLQTIAWSNMKGK